MKMSFLRKNNNFLSKKKNQKPFLLFFAIIILIIIFSLSWTRNMIFNMASPFWQLRNSFTSFVSENMGVFESKSSLLKENADLKNQIKDFEIQKNLFDAVKAENEDLKGILGRKNYSGKSVLSAVLEKPFLSPYDTLVIDVGSAEGISVDDKVLADDNTTFIGYVSQVMDNESKVTLYSSPGEKVEVLIGNNNILKDAYGIGGGNFTAEVPREFDIKEGDSITIPSISSNVFGIVEKIDYKEADSFETVFFKNPINMEELKWVVVVPKNSK